MTIERKTAEEIHETICWKWKDYKTGKLYKQSYDPPTDSCEEESCELKLSQHNKKDQEYYLEEARKQISFEKWFTKAYPHWERVRFEYWEGGLSVEGIPKKPSKPRLEPEKNINLDMTFHAYCAGRKEGMKG